MSGSLLSFLAWCLMMLAIIGVMLYLGRKSRRRDSKVEDVASEALPQIGIIADSCHEKRFGSRPCKDGKDAWYPAAKKKRFKHA